MKYAFIPESEAKKRGLKGAGHFIFHSRKGFIGPFPSKEAAEAWMKKEKICIQKAARCDIGW